MSKGTFRVKRLLYGATLLCACVAAADASAHDKVSRDARREMLAEPMWFVPRLGKRAAASQLPSIYDDPQMFAALDGVLETADAAYGDNHAHVHGSPDFYELPALMQALHASGKQYFTPRLGRETDADDARAVNFVPRLGRQLAANTRTQYAEESDRLEQRALHFSPRLGRENAYHFSPRLGRESPQ